MSVGSKLPRTNTYTAGLLRNPISCSLIYYHISGAQTTDLGASLPQNCKARALGQEHGTELLGRQHHGREPECNLRRYPLALSEASQSALRFLDQTIAVIDALQSEEDPSLQLSNFCVHEDGENGDQLPRLNALFCKRRLQRQRSIASHSSVECSWQSASLMI